MRFFASLQDVYEENGRHYATFYLMDTGVNRNNWRVTDEALEKALPSLIGKPLSAKPEYRVDHVSHPLDVGSWVKVDKPDGYAIGTAEITDPTAWEKIRAKEWGPVSVELQARKVTCSKCGQDITTEPCEHVQSREAHEVISEYSFDRFAFVSDPAYPLAGLLYAAGNSQSPRGDEPKGALNPELKGGKERLPEDNEIAELKRQLTAVTAERDQFKQKFDDANQKIAEKDELDKKVKDLQAELKQVKDERHLEKVKEVVNLRMQTGLATDANAETEKIKALDDPTLEIMKADVKAFVAEKERIVKLAGPKAKFQASNTDDLTKQVEDQREVLFGHRKSLFEKEGGAS